MKAILTVALVALAWVRLCAQGTVTVEGGSTLTGTGVVTAGTHPANGGRISPGDGVGTLTLSGLALVAGTIVDFELTTGTSDFISVTGTNQLVITGGGLHLYQPGTTNTFSTPGTYPLIGYAGAVQGSPVNLTILSPANGVAYRFVDNTSAHRIELVITSTFFSAVSRKAHGTAGAFDINLPLSSGRGIECRGPGPSGSYSLVFTFVNSLTGVNMAAVTAGTGTVGSAQIGATPNEYLVNLTDVTSGQRLTVTLNGISDTQGYQTPLLAIDVGILVGDANGDGTVNAADATVTRNRSGLTTDGTNFRADYNTDGFINAADATIVRARSGQFIPEASFRRAP